LTGARDVPPAVKIHPREAVEPRVRLGRKRRAIRPDAGQAGQSFTAENEYRKREVKILLYENSTLLRK
jgi:hypothetical protein